MDYDPVICALRNKDTPIGGDDRERAIEADRVRFSATQVYLPSAKRGLADDEIRRLPVCRGPAVPDEHAVVGCICHEEALPIEEHIVWRTHGGAGGWVDHRRATEVRLTKNEIGRLAV